MENPHKHRESSETTKCMHTHTNALLSLNEEKAEDTRNQRWVRARERESQRERERDRKRMIVRWGND